MSERLPHQFDADMVELAGEIKKEWPVIERIAQSGPSPWSEHDRDIVQFLACFALATVEWMDFVRGETHGHQRPQ